MIINQLTQEEFKSILKSVFSLENIENIFNNIYKIYHLPINKRPFNTETDNSGINTTYEDFDLKIRNVIYVNRDSSEHSRIIFEFSKKKSRFINFINPTRKIVTDLKKLCNAEIYNAQFGILPTHGFGHESLKVYFQKGTYNPDWEKQRRISPMVITTVEENNLYIVEFHFASECYERKNDKTVLKKDWEKIFRYSAPYWW